MRVVDSEICFLDAENAWGALGELTCLFTSRDEAYTAARKVSGLVVAIGYKVAEDAGLKHAIWDQQRSDDVAESDRS